MVSARSAALVAAALAALAILLAPAWPLAAGLWPADDALRHAAFATVDREWADVVVLRPDAARDQHETWHRLLKLAHRGLGLDAEGLVLLGLVGLAWIFGACGLLGSRARPEAWVIALALTCVAEPILASRWTCGRPLVAAMSALVLILLTWSAGDRGSRPGRALLALGTGAVAVGAGLHGSWYLFALPVAAFLLAGWWRAAIALGCCVAVGTLVAAIVTGEPAEAIVSPLRHLQLTMTAGSDAPWKVAELQPGRPALAAVLLAGLAVIARWRLRPGARKPWNEPSLVLAVLCAVLGLAVRRFWVDWGLPALAAFVAIEAQALMVERLRSNVARIVAALAGLMALTAALAGDRWSGRVPHAVVRAAELGDFAPEPGGILYNERMADFYASFFEDPGAPWRYELGFEPALMPPEDLEIYRAMQRGNYELETFLPWVRRMTPRDRLLLHWQHDTPPPALGLQWRRVNELAWIGRVPR